MRSAKTRCAGPESDSEIDAVVCWLLGTERGCALQPWLFLPLLRKLDWKKKKKMCRRHWGIGITAMRLNEPKRSPPSASLQCERVLSVILGLFWNTGLFIRPAVKKYPPSEKT